MCILCSAMSGAAAAAAASDDAGGSDSARVHASSHPAALLMDGWRCAVKGAGGRYHPVLSQLLQCFLLHTHIRSSCVMTLESCCLCRSSCSTITICRRVSMRSTDQRSCTGRRGPRNSSPQPCGMMQLSWVVDVEVKPTSTQPLVLPDIVPLDRLHRLPRMNQW